MEFHELASILAKEEGKKHQATIGDIREILSILSEIMAEDEKVVEMLLENGRRKISEHK
jgi:hypothetical protein